MESTTPTIRIAIVDDHKLFRQGIIQILKHFTHFDVIIEADNCQDLLAAVHEKMPDIILMDLQMPDMDGMEGCKLLLQHYPNLKIIALSMHSADNFIFHMMKCGARSYLPKDVDQEKLKEAIEEVYKNGYHFNDMITRAMLRGVKTNPRAKPNFQTKHISLTQREKEILELLCKGFTTNDIADQLFISARTVEGHRKNLLEKTGTQNSVSLAVYAVKTGMLEDYTSTNA